MSEALNINPFKNYYKKTALHVAAESNDLSRLEYLCSLGVDINIRDRNDRTPLHYATFNNVDETYLNVIVLLLKNGADIDARDNVGKTPLFYLVKNGNLKILKIFLNYKANFNVLDNCGRSLLTSATGSLVDNIEVIQLLLKLGLDANHCCIDRNTPLLWSCITAALTGNLKVIKCLLKNNANMNTINNAGYIPAINGVKKICDSQLSEETKKKFLNFILNHTDFSILNYKNIGIFTLINFHPVQLDLDCSSKMILQHLAKLKMLNLPVHQAHVKNIPKQHEHHQYYKLCIEELLRAESIKLQDSWVTFYNLLIGNRKDLKNYAGNRNLLKNFKSSDCIKKFPIFGTTIIENVNKGIRRRTLFDKAAIILNDCLPIFNPSHLIIRDLLDCITSTTDLSKFCE